MFTVLAVAYVTRQKCFTPIQSRKLHTHTHTHTHTDRETFPDRAEMEQVIVDDEREHLGHFYDSPRHRMQVDFTTYVADLHKELERGSDRTAEAVA